RGHAPDNIVIAFPWSSVLFAGCLVKAAEATELGFTGDADFTSWPKALHRVAARYPNMQIVTGHGPLEPPPTIAHTLDLLAARRKWRGRAARRPTGREHQREQRQGDRRVGGDAHQERARDRRQRHPGDVTADDVRGARERTQEHE